MPPSRRSQTLPRSSRRLTVTMGVVLALLAGVLAACGGGDGGGENVDTVLDETFRSEQKLDSGKLTLDATARLEGAAQLQGPVTIKMNGPFDGLEGKIADTGEIPKADLEISASAAGQDFSAGFT